MKKDELFRLIGDIDEQYIAEAKTPVRSVAWRRWGALAACLVLLLGGSFLWRQMRRSIPPVDTTVHEAPVTDSTADTTVGKDMVACGFRLGECVYYPISFEERKQYGLAPADATGLTKDITYAITEQDLGEQMGTIEDCANEDLIGAKVYHFAPYPNNDAICIVEQKDRQYDFYTASEMVLSDEKIANSNGVLEVYGMPASVTKITVQSGDWQTLWEITDSTQIAEICALLSDKEDIGLAGNEQRYAQLWYDTYGNHDVYYDEEAGHMRYVQPEIQEPPDEPTITTDAEGNTVVSDVSENSTETQPDNYDLARALWDEGERVLCFVTERGFSFYAIYTPSIQTVSMYGYYVLTDAEIAQMNALLQIE